MNQYRITYNRNSGEDKTREKSVISAQTQEEAFAIFLKDALSVKNSNVLQFSLSDGLVTFQGDHMELWDEKSVFVPTANDEDICGDFFVSNPLDEVTNLAEKFLSNAGNLEKFLYTLDADQLQSAKKYFE